MYCLNCKSEMEPCVSCGAELPNECWVYEHECFGECHGAPAWDLVPMGYTCVQCGYHMDI